MSYLSVEDLNYRKLTDIDMEFKEGSLYFISGANKCGKTTLSRLLAGLIETKDTIFYNNKDLYSMSSLSLSKKIKLLSSSDELVSNLEKIGFKSVSLGSRILRVETVPLYILSIINYEVMEW